MVEGIRASAHGGGSSFPSSGDRQRRSITIREWRRWRNANDSHARSDVPPMPSPTNVQGLEPLLSINDVAVIYGLSPGTIRRDLQRGTFQPEPWDKYPYRWKRSALKRILRPARKLRKRPHGRYAKPAAKATNGERACQTGGWRSSPERVTRCASHPLPWSIRRRA